MGIKEFRKSKESSGSVGTVFAVDWDFQASEAVILPERRNNLNETPFFLKVFHINDLHGNIYRFNPDGSSTGVFSRIVNQVEKAQLAAIEDDNEGVIFLSAGDDSIGTAIDYLTGYDGEDFLTHPVYKAFSIGGVDATILGNHDLDTGIKTLKQSITRDASFPILSANLQHQGELDGFVFPGAIAVVKGVRIGLIGLTPPGQVRSRKGSEYTIGDPYESVMRVHDLISPFCDVMIILSHLGYKLGSTFATVNITGDMELASRLKKSSIDLIVGGHTHDFLNINGLESKNLVDGIPILQAGYNGLFFGKGIMRVSRKNNLLKTSIIPTCALSVSDKFDLNYVSMVGSHVATLRNPLGRMNIPGSFFTDKCEINRDSSENPMANFITDALCSELRGRNLSVDFTSIDSSSMVSFFDFRKESINIIDLYRLMPYADTLVIFNLSGRDLERIIISNALRLDYDDIPNIPRGFMHFSKEVRYNIDKERSVSDITIKGIPVKDCYDRFFSVAAPNFVQGLGANWEKSDSMRGKHLSNIRDYPSDDIGLYVRKELLAYIEKNGISEESGFLTDGRLNIV